MSSTVVIPSILNTEVRSILNPIYKFLRVPLNNVSIPPILAGGSQQWLEWKLPTQVYNLSRSYLSWNESYPAQTHYIWTHEDVFTLGSQITFGQSAGVNLVDLQFAQNFSKIKRKISTPLGEYLKYSDMAGLYKCNTPPIPPVVAVAGGASTAYTDPNTGNMVPGSVAGAFTAFDAYVEPRYTATGGDTLAVNRYRQYPLGAFQGTMLGMDKEFYSPTEMYLRINAGTCDKMAFTSTNITNPSTGAATIANGGVTINNCYLYLAVETNAPVIADIMQRYSSGMLSYQIPFTVGFKNVGSAAGATTNISIQLSQQYGRKLKRILHTVFNPTESLNLAYDCQNYNGSSKVVSYQTFMDNLPQQDRILVCARPTGSIVGMDDWFENRRFMENSVITSKEAYQLNWFHQDQFYGSVKREDNLNTPEDNLDEGLPMSAPHQWLFSSTAGTIAGLLHYTYAEFARDIVVTPAGAQFA